MNAGNLVRIYHRSAERFGCGCPRSPENTMHTKHNGDACRECSRKHARNGRQRRKEEQLAAARRASLATVQQDADASIALYRVEKARRAERHLIPDDARIAYLRCLEAKPALSLGRSRKLNVKASEDLADYLPVFVGDSRR